MKQNIVNCQIPLEAILPCRDFYLKNISKIFEYVDRNKTDKVIGYCYTVINVGNLEECKVKVKSLIPLISEKELDAAENYVRVHFIGAKVRYYVLNNRLGASITADDVELIDDEEVVL